MYKYLQDHVYISKSQSIFLFIFTNISAKSNCKTLHVDSRTFCRFLILSWWRIAPQHRTDVKTKRKL